MSDAERDLAQYRTWYFNWTLALPRWLREKQAKVYDEILRRIYAPVIASEMNAGSALMERLHG